MRSASPYEIYGVYSPPSDGSLVEHVFDVSETITGVAHRHYGDWTLWREIARRNGLTDPRRIAPGTRLLIPARQLEAGLESL